jgi:hypothetical protein
LFPQKLKESNKSFPFLWIAKCSEETGNTIASMLASGERFRLIGRGFIFENES